MVPRYQSAPRAQPLHAIQECPLLSHYSTALTPCTPFITSSRHLLHSTRLPLQVNKIQSKCMAIKRRPNLTAEAVETLRAWFADHENHPYPSTVLSSPHTAPCLSNLAGWCPHHPIQSCGNWSARFENEVVTERGSY